MFSSIRRDRKQEDRIMTQELKSCPFCGGEGSIQEHVFIGFSSTYGIVCLDCGAKSRQFFDTKQEAIDAWDRRVNDDTVQRP